VIDQDPVIDQNPVIDQDPVVEETPVTDQPYELGDLTVKELDPSVEPEPHDVMDRNEDLY
jgi:hypothetical protein